MIKGRSDEHSPPPTAPHALMKGEELLFSFSFVFSYISLLFKYPFKGPVMSQIFLTLQGIAADPLSAKPIFTGIIMSIWYLMNPDSELLSPSQARPCSRLFGCFGFFFPTCWATQTLIFL